MTCYYKCCKPMLFVSALIWCILCTCYIRLLTLHDCIVLTSTFFNNECIQYSCIKIKKQVLPETYKQRWRHIKSNQKRKRCYHIDRVFNLPIYDIFCKLKYYVRYKNDAYKLLSSPNLSNHQSETTNVFTLKAYV